MSWLGLRPLRWVTTNYHPDPENRPFLNRLQRRERDGLHVAVAVLSDRESVKFFGTHLARRGVQPVWIEVDNQSADVQRLDLFSLDPNYYTPLEAAVVSHFSVGKRLVSFGLLGWLFLILLPLLPSKLISARNANRRMTRLFKDHSFRLGPIQSGTSRSGVVFTSLDEGLKNIVLRFVSGGKVSVFDFSLEVPGLLIRPTRDDDEARGERVDTIGELIDWSSQQARCTSNCRGSVEGDPLNLLIVGSREVVRQCFGGKWDDAEAISFATCLKTAKAFLLDSAYRYSPVSSLFVDGKIQDLALQRARASINERIHLRLWLANLNLDGTPVWIGQVSRDIGIRFTTKTWNLTTHRIDPDVDEARDYVVDSLADGGRLAKMSYLPGCQAADDENPRRNLTGDTYVTDGKRALLILSPTPVAVQFLTAEEMGTANA